MLDLKIDFSHQFNLVDNGAAPNMMQFPSVGFPVVGQPFQMDSSFRETMLFVTFSILVYPVLPVYLLIKAMK